MCDVIQSSPETFHDIPPIRSRVANFYLDITSQKARVIPTSNMHIDFPYSSPIIPFIRIKFIQSRALGT